MCAQRIFNGEAGGKDISHRVSPQAYFHVAGRRTGMTLITVSARGYSRRQVPCADPPV